MLFLGLRLVKEGRVLAEGSLVVTREECCACFGDSKEVRLNVESHAQSVTLFGGLFVEHHIEERGALLLLKCYELTPTGDPRMLLAQKRRFRSATVIPTGYNSKGEEAMPLVEGYELLFTSRWFDDRSSN